MADFLPSMLMFLGSIPSNGKNRINKQQTDFIPEPSYDGYRGYLECHSEDGVNPEMNELRSTGDTCIGTKQGVMAAVHGWIVEVEGSSLWL